MTPDQHYWHTAAQVCTDQELRALELRSRGLGSRRIQLILHCSRTHVRDLLARADQKVADQLGKEESAA